MSDSGNDLDCYAEIGIKQPGTYNQSADREGVRWDGLDSFLHVKRDVLSVCNKYVDFFDLPHVAPSGLQRYLDVFEYLLSLRPAVTNTNFIAALVK